MRSFKDIYYSLLTEGVVNLIGTNSIDQRQKYVDQVWDILQESYRKMNGIKGSGFESKEAMVAKIPFWKLYIQNGRVLVVIMYKDKGGRKTVALGIDKSPKSKQILERFIKESYKIGWGEYSKAALIYIMGQIPFEVIEPYFLTPSEVQALLPKDQIIPLSEYPSVQDLHKFDHHVLDKHPELNPYFYIRDIGGVPYLKVSLGTPHKPIV
jgi:hypothetical protein